ncbi:hypothetical protein CY35_06G114800 [Sphagnum magellanicum]|nr:hypothetical protein CY35_06G114800 [Sphagnum magellanicum]
MKWLLKSFQILVPVLACLVNNLNLAEAVDRCNATNLCTDPTAPCCSQYGYCGSEDPYCGKGCQSQCQVLPSALSSKYACGRKASNALCPTAENPCCSMYGYCGNGKEYCGDGCQSQCDSGAPTTSRAWVWKLIVMGIIIPVAAGVFIVVFFIMPRCKSEIDSDLADGIELPPLLKSSSYDENKPM